MTPCAICRSPCAGSDETKNPFCPDCLLLNFCHSAWTLWAVDREQRRDLERAAPLSAAHTDTAH
jgi:hypothetical protein